MARLTNSRFALGVHALTLLADSAPRRVSSEEMSDSTRANPVHLRRVLGELRAAGLVESKGGVGGGWTLAVDPEDVSLRDLWAALNDDDPILGLRAANPDCQVGRAVQGALVDVDREIRQTVEERLGELTIADMRGRVAA